MSLAGIRGAGIGSPLLNRAVLAVDLQRATFLARNSAEPAMAVSLVGNVLDDRCAPFGFQPPDVSCLGEMAFLHA